MEVPIEVENTLQLFTSGIGGPDIQQIGSDPVWEDNSDATYVDLVAKFFGPSEPQFYSLARAFLPAQTFVGRPGITSSSPRLKVRMDIRIKAVQSGLPFPRVTLEAAGGLNYGPDSKPALVSTSPETVTLEWSDFGNVWGNPDSFNIDIKGDNPTPVPGSTGTVEVRNWHIYELRAYFYAQADGAPPCRITGRGDEWGRGSGRIVPRPKSQQSGRFRGFY